MKTMFEKVLKELPIIIFFIAICLLMYSVLHDLEIKPVNECSESCIPLASEVIDGNCWCRIDRNTMKLYSGGE